MARRYGHGEVPRAAFTAALFPRLRRLNLHQNPAETLHIRRLENGLERPCGRSLPAPRHLASLVVADAFAGELTRGSFKTIPATEETANTPRLEEDSWLTTQSRANRSPRVNSLLTGNLTGNFSNLGLFLRFSLLINEQMQMLAAKFPSKWNREFFRWNRELFLPNREF